MSKVFRHSVSSGHRTKENSLLAQKIAERKGCVICDRKPTIYMVAMKGYCAKHKAAAEAQRIRDSIFGTAAFDVDTARRNDCRKVLDKKGYHRRRKLGY